MVIFTIKILQKLDCFLKKFQTFHYFQKIHYLLFIIHYSFIKNSLFIIHYFLKNSNYYGMTQFFINEKLILQKLFKNIIKKLI